MNIRDLNSAARDALRQRVAQKLYGYNAYIERLWIQNPAVHDDDRAVIWNDDAARTIASAIIDEVIAATEIDETSAMGEPYPDDATTALSALRLAVSAVDRARIQEQEARQHQEGTYETIDCLTKVPGTSEESLREALETNRQAHEAVMAALSARRHSEAHMQEAAERLGRTVANIAPRPTDTPAEVSDLQIAQAIIGPRHFIAKASKFTLEQLRDVRWDRATNHEQRDALNAAKAVRDLFGSRGYGHQATIDRGDLADRLTKLDAAATQGELRGGHRCDGSIRVTVEGERVSLGQDIPAADAALWADLTNAFRDGSLIVRRKPQSDQPDRNAEGEADPRLLDPIAVHINLLRGTIAKPSIESIIHLYGATKLREELGVSLPSADTDVGSCEDLERAAQVAEAAAAKARDRSGENATWGGPPSSDEEALRASQATAEEIVKGIRAIIATRVRSVGADGTRDRNSEAIARIIDPYAFAFWDGQREYGLGKGYSVAEAERIADSMHGTRRKGAFDKADAILGLTTSPNLPDGSVPEGEGVDLLRRVRDLEAEVERLTKEADGEFVQAAYRVMKANPGFDARDYWQEGVTATDFEEFFTEDMNEAWRQVEELKEKSVRFDRLLIAFHDAIRRPLGVTPDSGVEFYDYRLAEKAEQDRPRLGSLEERSERPDVKLVATEAALEEARAELLTLRRLATDVAMEADCETDGDALIEEIELHAESEARAQIAEERILAALAALKDACRMSSILLMAGEMTAQERRTARAVANGLRHRVRRALGDDADE